MRIISNSQESDGSYSSGTGDDSAKPDGRHSTHSRKRLGFVLGELVPILGIIALPFTVHAGVLSSLVNMLSSETIIVEASKTEIPATEIALLSATTNPDPTGAQGGGQVVTEDGALLSGGVIGETELGATKNYSGEISVYVVREGDTLSQIAEMFGVTNNTIVWANDIKNGVLQPGQSLVILPIAGVRHVVKEGEVLSDIVEKYEADMTEVMEYNQLSEDSTLTVGETLVVPGGQVAAPVRVATRPASSGSSASAGSATGFVHPAPGTVRTQGIHGYNGVDFAVGGGGSVDIRAAAAGQVIVSKGSGWNGGYGNYIVIKHNDGSQTLYSHLSSNYVVQGEWVGSGQAIGHMGNTGRSTGTHLHFEVRGARNPF